MTFDKKRIDFWQPIQLFAWCAQSLAALPAASFLGGSSSSTAGNAGAVGAIGSDIVGAIEPSTAGNSDGVGEVGAVPGGGHVSSRDVVVESLRRQLADAQVQGYLAHKKLQ